MGALFRQATPRKTLFTQGSGKHDQRNAARTVQAEGPGAFVKRCARGHHIINQQDMLAAEVFGAVKCLANVLPTRFPWEIGLDGSVSNPGADSGAEWTLQRVCDGAREFERLVEPACFQTVRVQGQRQDKIGREIAGYLDKRLRKVGAEGESVAVFEGLDEFVDRKAVAERGAGFVEMGRRTQALTTNFTLRCGVSAAWAAVFGESRQISIAGSAQDRRAVAAAQQAILGEEVSVLRFSEGFEGSVIG